MLQFVYSDNRENPEILQSLLLLCCALPFHLLVILLGGSGNKVKC